MALPLFGNMKNGFSTLFIVIVIGSIMLGLATSSLWSVLGSIDNKDSGQAKSLVNACAEVALEAMRENTNYLGSGSETIGSNTCTYTVTNGGGNNRTIIASGSVGIITRKLRITTSAFNPIIISSWQEVADF
jgi:type II secretory pathway pseudopilin PulG